MNETGIPARRSAVYLLDQIIGQGRLMAELVQGGALERLSLPDRARAQRLANDVLRGVERADKLISKHVKKMPPLPVLNLLRLGAVEMAHGAAAHGVVNDLVNIAARSKRHGRLKGLVNAVLRKLAETAAMNWSGLVVPRMPAWLRTPLVHAWGRETISGIEAAQFAGAPIDLTPKTDAQAVAEMTGGQVLSTGSVRLGPNAGQVSALAGFESGDWWVQDAAAALPARLIKGQSVVDLCAAPGGKTMQLSAAGHRVTAVDASEHRMKRVAENLERTGLSADLQVCDAREISGTWDAVLLDAPCSATGTIRRHPDLPYAKDGSEFGGLIDLQAELIDHAVSLLAPSGQLVFCTCSLLPDEGEVQIEEALGRHQNLSLDTDALSADWIEEAWRSEEGGLRLRPDFWSEAGGMDGFYIAALRKTG